jgi:7,8-dihydropterin-6-yl-methyl-4-(beta-D-ribofuranosyl)aminobenzene 5'-phosphate synthase
VHPFSVIARLPADPTFELIKEAGGTVEVNGDSHTVADSTIFVSGEIPRVTDFEGGILGGMRWIEGDGPGMWISENVYILLFSCCFETSNCIAAHLR